MIMKSTIRYLELAKAGMKKQEQLKQELEMNQSKRKRFEVCVDDDDILGRAQKRARESGAFYKESKSVFVREVLKGNEEALVWEKENIPPGLTLPVEESSVWFDNKGKKTKRTLLWQQTESEECSAPKRRKIR